MTVVLLPNPTGVTAGQVATIELPLGPTYDAIHIHLTASIGADPVVNVAVDNWGDYIGDMRLIVNGVNTLHIAAADWVALMKYHRQEMVAGVLPLMLKTFWARTMEGEDQTSYGTQGIDTFTLEIDLKEGINIGKLRTYADWSAPKPFGSHLNIQRHPNSTVQAGEKELTGFNRGNFVSLGFFMTTAQTDRIIVKANGNDVYDTIPLIRQSRGRLDKKTQQAGYTMVGFMDYNRFSNTLPMLLSEFRINVDFTAANINFATYHIAMKGANI